MKFKVNRLLLVANCLLVFPAFSAFRPPAVPLVSVDPHFSLWSVSDRLNESNTVHWSGAQQPLKISLCVNGRNFRLCGVGDGLAVEQTGVEVRATTSAYAFVLPDGRRVELDFITPRLADDLTVFSRPVAYVSLRVDGARDWSATAEISGAFATNDDAAEMDWVTNRVAGLPAVSVGRRNQVPFSDRGDRRRPQWGRAWLVGPVSDDEGVHFLLAYDNVMAVRFFGRDLQGWWRQGGTDFQSMLAAAERDYSSLLRKTRAFDRRLATEAEAIGGTDYARLAQLAWRQSFAACTLAEGPGGEPFMFSCENGSGGMIGTTDVFYPQLPHLLMANPALAKATLAPTCIYAASTNWPYAYAPHDLGLFPVAEGQYYGMKKGQAIGGRDDDASRMPVEECGNMLICLAAVARLEGNADFAGRWWPMVTGWANYLEKVGFDPCEQLCTDDFAGHLAHNANLSVKTIVALGAYAQMAGLRGEKDVAERFAALAADMAKKWQKAAAGGREGATKLTLDPLGFGSDTWSQKYNLVWDRLLGLGLFPPEIGVRECAAYRRLLLPYGLPLDSRRNYSKGDWTVWSATLSGKREDFVAIVSGYCRFAHETPDRVPLTDWYWADNGRYRGFVARSVVGGVFLPFLCENKCLVRGGKDKPQ